MESLALSCRETKEKNKKKNNRGNDDLWFATLVEVSRQIVLHSEVVDVASEPWPETQWQTAFRILVFEVPTGLASAAAEKDDLIFLLDTKRKRVITRRRKKDPAALLEEFASTDVIDWKASVMMYIIMHTTFQFSALVDSVSRLDSSIHSVMKYGSSSVDAPSGSLPGSSEVSAATTAHCVLPTEAVFRQSSAYPDIVFMNLEDTLHSNILLRKNNCFACVLGADVQHSWGVSSGHYTPGYHTHASGALIQVFSGYVTFDQIHSATEDNVAHHVVSRLQKLMRQGDSRHAVTPAQHTLDLRGYRNSGVAHVLAGRILSEEGAAGIEIHVKDLHMYTFEAMAVQICQQICELEKNAW